MSSVWIVFDDEDDAGIYGVFDNREDAETYAGEVNHITPSTLLPHDVRLLHTGRTRPVEFEVTRAYMSDQQSSRSRLAH